MGLFKQFQEMLSQGDTAPRPPVHKSPPDRAQIQRSYLPEPLTIPDKVDLLALRKHPGYEVILKIMERICEVAVSDLIKSDPANVASVVAAQTMAKASWKFYTDFQQAVEIEIDSVMQPQDKIALETEPDLDDPMTLNRLFDPLSA